MHAENSITIGSLLGYPKTAVQAFYNEFALGKSSHLSGDEMGRMFEESPGLDKAVAGFRFSRMRWREEIRYVQELNAMLNEAGLFEYGREASAA